ncbi:alpha/beta hydrolase [Azohydromonas lata]|uniref:Alpha/beta hydrolase n=1 Tax=Azohydromonas lata TaxID=45677 RepID=A0ABU5ILY8_9BURK|nr:alpha/beta hydrolase [Azohydromonas lata]MDZ5459869.1 alpha/beta hydrolase [Azohydromonas lata]
MTASPKLYRNFATQAEIDGQYNPSLGVDDPAAEMRHYVETSRQAREKLPNVLNVPYGPTLAETLDIFPAAQADAPVFVFIHGGYWRALSAGDFSGVALGPQALGITTVVVNYALCPQVSIDEITRQTRAAVAWVLRNIGQYGGDPSRVAVGGHSAGGHLAAMSLLAPWARDYGLPEDPLAGALLFSGLYELEPLRWSYLQPMIQLDEGVIRRNSPTRLVRSCATPAWVTWGALESSEFARQSIEFAEAWRRAGNEVELSPVADTHHFTVIHGLEDAASPVCRWLAARLGL